ncbi:MAG: IPT/TIG domain-containing protein [Planctomycetes bacterium]|nr:IPT/TIG domain-containing protein [Planctomycetota bacterium]
MGSTQEAKFSFKRLLSRAALLVAAFGAGAGMADGYVRIVLGGKTLHWSDPNIDWQLNTESFSGLDSVGVSDAADRAFATWNQISKSAINFQRGADTAAADYSKSSHLVYLDSDNSSGFFPNGSGTVAITPIIYSTSDGRMIDVDIIFNGKDFDFALHAGGNDFDLQDVMTHEIGHMIGLDHSPVHGSSMWPYVAPGQWLHRSLTQDDISGGIAAAKIGGIAVLKGKLHDFEGENLQGGGVGLIRADDGRLAATGISNANGNWVVKGIPAGQYYVYAFPIEGYMTAANFTSDSAVKTDFGVEFYGGFGNPYQITATQGDTTDCGTLQVARDGAVQDVFRHAQLIAQGETKAVTVFGSNLQANNTTLIDFSNQILLGSSTSTSSMVSTMASVGSNCPVGSYDLFLELANGELEVVPGAIEVVAAAPKVTSLNLSNGDISGGDEVIVEGENFVDGAYVIVGGREAQATQFIHSTRIGFTTPASDGGVADVIVQNPDGQEATLIDAFQYSAIPRYADLFPRAGYRGGGTELRVIGSGFTSGMSVEIDGTTSTPTVHSSTFFTVIAPPASRTGSVDIVLVSADQVRTSYADIYTYVNTPDPRIESFTPESGKKNGGTEVNLYGDNLGGSVRVRFGVDPVTAQGGQFAGGVELAANSKLTMTTPSNPVGSYGVVVELPNGQGAIANSTFQFEGSLSAGGGCGGVATGQSGGKPSDWLAFVILIGGWYLLQRPKFRHQSV